jgi:anti-anti-sigma regulatory factor/anti-sigma regulatory factor (Ser/Thr protein kinase)
MGTFAATVTERLPVAVVTLAGPLEELTLSSCLVTLRDCLADQPRAVVADLSQLTRVSDRAVTALADFATEAARWPGADLMLCGASPEVASALATLASRPGVELFDSVAEARAAGAWEPDLRRDSVVLVPDRTAPEVARVLVKEACEEWGVRRLSRLAQLIVSELVTNGVVHARTELRVTVRLSGRTLSLAVRDGDPRLLYPAGGGVEADGDGYGRGLLIVDSMADSWGCTPTADGKVTWAVLELPANMATPGPAQR